MKHWTYETLALLGVILSHYFYLIVYYKSIIVYKVLN